MYDVFHRPAGPRGRRFQRKGERHALHFLGLIGGYILLVLLAIIFHVSRS